MELISQLYLKTPYHLFKRTDDGRWVCISRSTNEAPSILTMESGPDIWNIDIHECTKEEYEKEFDQVVKTLKGRAS